ncbi:MAG: DNA-packaging protein [Deltaproteobacteria bacterium]|nr:DNA-packaging protein [Deltaproteobacteria bacterium]
MLSLEKIRRPPPKGSWLSNILTLPANQAEKFIRKLSDEEANLFQTDWLFQAREAQYREEGNWKLWVIDAGRGFGKTRSGAEWVTENALSRGIERQALVAPTYGDLRKVMIEGESGILAVCPQAIFNQQRQTITFPNGNIAEGFSAEKPSRLRGPQFGGAWCDEVSSWTYDQETWDMLEFALRLGSNPQTLVTSTPKPRPLYKNLLKIADRVSRGSTYENQDNLAKGFIEKVKDRYEGTRLGRQELYAELLDDIEGALWTRSLIKYGVSEGYLRIVVAVDPAVTSNPDSDETGVVVAGKGIDGRGYVLADHSCKATPLEWARIAVNAYHSYKADRIVAEVNNGGDLVETIIKTIDRNVPVYKVHASRGKETRAEPVSALYEQGKIEHVKPFDLLEDQMCNWIPSVVKKSPDRVDALVWAFTELLLKNQNFIGIS